MNDTKVWVTPHALSYSGKKEQQMIRAASAICAILLLCACTGRSKGDGTISPATPQALVSSNGDKLNYVGNWSSCVPETNGQFKGNNISFSINGADLVFIPAIGIVGLFSDAACTKAVPEEAMGVSPIAGLHISMIKTIAIAPQSNPRFTGTVDELSDLENQAFKFAGFSPDYKSAWFSSTSSFDGVVVRYDKK
jgi:hypothetical protein